MHGKNLIGKGDVGENVFLKYSSMCIRSRQVRGRKKGM